MTEKEFDQQVWRRFDTVTIDTGMETTIMNVCFSTRSVRIYLKSAPPEWVSFDRITGHKSRFGGDPDDLAIIEELHNKIMKRDEELEQLREKNKELKEKNGKNYLADLLRAVNLMQQGLTEKKHKMEQIDSGLKQIGDIIEKNKLDV